MMMRMMMMMMMMMMVMVMMMMSAQILQETRMPQSSCIANNAAGSLPAVAQALEVPENSHWVEAQRMHAA